MVAPPLPVVPVFTDCATTTALAVSQATCEQLPDFAKVIYDEGENLTWDYVQYVGAGSPIGTTLGMIRFTGLADGSRVEFDGTDIQGSYGPLILHGGIFSDYLSWFTQPGAHLPVWLFLEGYDVFIFNRRGTGLSRVDDSGTGGYDPDTSQDYWNFSQEEIAFDLVEAGIAVTQIKQNEGECTKVQYLTYGTGGAELLIGLNQSVAAGVDQVIGHVVNQAQCHVPSANEATNLIGNDDSIYPRGRRLQRDTSRRNRRLSHSGSPKSPKSPKCDKSGYYAELRTIKYETLDRDQYREFYGYMKQWKNDNREKENYCGVDGPWVAGIQECLCLVDNTQGYCSPSSSNAVDVIFNALVDNGIYSMFGPDWDNQLNTFCTAIGGELAQPCIYLRSLGTAGSSGYKETSVKLYEQHIRQSIAQDNIQWTDTWREDNWFADVPTYDLSQINVPIHTQYVEGDAFCPEILNQEIQDTITTQVKKTVFTDGQTYGTLYGQTLAEEWVQLLADIYTDPGVPDVCP